MTNTMVRLVAGMDVGEVVGHEADNQGRAWVQVQWLGSDVVDTVAADELVAA